MTVQLHGELDLCSAELLTAALRNHLGHRVICLDLSGLSFLDCAGIRAIRAAHERQARRSAALLLANVQPRIRRVLALTQADRLLQILDSDDPSTPNA